jgi:hypothetical protein
MISGEPAFLVEQRFRGLGYVWWWGFFYLRWEYISSPKISGQNLQTIGVTSVAINQAMTAIPLPMER